MISVIHAHEIRKIKKVPRSIRGEKSSKDMASSSILQGSIAYAPQEAWIQNLTVRDNVLFGERFSGKKYRKVLQACSLLQDLEILSAGDQTEIGERVSNGNGVPICPQVLRHSALLLLIIIIRQVRSNYSVTQIITLETICDN